jgi:carbon monoxide dehydrogenase subunit G
MKTLRERIVTTLPLDDAFAYIADFANAQEWDPGVAIARRVDDGPIGPGARYQLNVRMGRRVAPMEYCITTFDPPNRVVLTGRGSNVDAIDDIAFEATPDGTAIDYTADIRLGGLLRVAEPFLGGAFERIGRDAANGMRRTLAQRAAADLPAVER